MKKERGGWVRVEVSIKTGSFNKKCKSFRCRTGK